MNLWQELRRRKVFRTAGLYIVGAWLVIQVADIFFPAWGLPETGIRFLFIAAAALFPVALVFGWFYDVTSAGIVRTEPFDDSTAVDLSLKRFDYAVLVALFVIGTAILLGSIQKIQEEITTSPGNETSAERLAHSIAVLPFTNLDANPDTRFFSDGITEEILHRLSTLGALHVLASTSSFAFRDSSDTPASISEKLGVRFLLQGSVRREGDQVRVTARLLDGDGFQVWSDSFDRKLERIFAIQTEIASKVSSEIIEEIVPPQELPAGRTTQNMEAYNEYLKGRAYFDMRTAGWKEDAEAAFRRAIELDPEFAPPYAGLATLVVNSDVGPHWEQARQMAEKALQLDAGLPLGHAILGLTQSVLGDPARGLESLHKAIELDPSLGIAYNWIQNPLSRLGRSDEALAMKQRGLEVDPLNPALIRNIAGENSRGGDFERATQLLLRLTGLPEPPAWTYDQLALHYAEWGRYVDAVAAAKDYVRHMAGTGDPWLPDRLLDSYASLGLVDDAAFWLEELRSQWFSSETDPPLHASLQAAQWGVGQRWLAADLESAEKLLADGEDHDEPYLLSYGGLAWMQAGNPAKGAGWLERGILLYQQQLAPADDPPSEIDYRLLDRNWRTDTVVRLAERLAFGYSTLGRADAKDAALRYLGEVHASPGDRMSPYVLERNAVARLLAGDAVGALESLRRAADLGWANYYLIMNDPLWAEARQAPELQSLLAEVKAEIERQRAIVVAADAEHDFRAEIERLSSAKSMAR